MSPSAADSQKWACLQMSIYPSADGGSATVSLVRRDQRGRRRFDYRIDMASFSYLPEDPVEADAVEALVAAVNALAARRGLAL